MFSQEDKPKLVVAELIGRRDRRVVRLVIPHKGDWKRQPKDIGSLSFVQLCGLQRRGVRGHRDILVGDAKMSSMSLIARKEPSREVGGVMGGLWREGGGREGGREGGGVSEREAGKRRGMK